MFLGSAGEVRSGTDPICQSWARRQGHNSNQAFRAGRYHKLPHAAKSSNGIDRSRAGVTDKGKWRRHSKTGTR
ncbi:hypothetical protein Pcinc_032887 [Petrolisthes cinctipes]|uniref:Uncharacterized protein n=1 Tax=Petrolisthes cinctipes TaxID=88211 RepID=A0AAE1K0I2_PETCI|nr:hypothetical protein Pcinc_032887 [Petrolisthes cinctipes]